MGIFKGKHRDSNIMERGLETERNQQRIHLQAWDLGTLGLIL